jgi:non-ribosomal peptide synthetase component E (peptide arylation enzyme)
VKIVGRLKEMINRGGKSSFRARSRDSLYPSEDLHAAIVGVPDSRLGERNCLCVIPRPGQTIAPRRGGQLLQDSVATYKLPETIEIFDELRSRRPGRSSATCS